MPNIGGTGYYRFDLAPADWQALISSSATLSPDEAIATTDSLWASFRAGKAPAAWLIAEARALAFNPDAAASVDPGERIAGWRSRGLIAPSSLPAYRWLMASVYTPQLKKLGFDPAVGAHAGDDPGRQNLRHRLVGLVADDARDPAVRAKLKGAASRFLGGEATALDPGFLSGGLTALSQDGGLPVAKMLVERGLSSEDPTLRSSALAAAASSGRADVAEYLLSLNDKRMRGFDRLQVIFGIVGTVETRDLGTDWVLANYDRLVAGANGIFITSRLPTAFASQCGVDRAASIDAKVGSGVRKANAGLLAYQRALESIRLCGTLKAAKLTEIAAAITKGS
jgi:hypothetical protein